MSQKPAPTLGALRAQRDAILAVCAQHGAYDVRVFGSVARGEASPSSDVDLLVRFQPDRSILDHSALRLDLMDLLGCEVDVVSEHPRMREHFRQRVMKEAVAL